MGQWSTWRRKHALLSSVGGSYSRALTVNGQLNYLVKEIRTRTLLPNAAQMDLFVGNRGKGIPTVRTVTEKFMNGFEAPNPQSAALGIRQAEAKAVYRRLRITG